jgi:hypothetical protein
LKMAYERVRVVAEPGRVASFRICGVYVGDVHVCPTAQATLHHGTCMPAPYYATPLPKPPLTRPSRDSGHVDRIQCARAVERRGQRDGGALAQKLFDAKNSLSASRKCRSIDGRLGETHVEDPHHLRAVHDASACISENEGRRQHRSRADRARWCAATPLCPRMSRAVPTGSPWNSSPGSTKAGTLLRTTSSTTV